LNGRPPRFSRTLSDAKNLPVITCYEQARVKPLPELIESNCHIAAAGKQKSTFYFSSGSCSLQCNRPRGGISSFAVTLGPLQQW